MMKYFLLVYLISKEPYKERVSIKVIQKTIHSESSDRSLANHEHLFSYVYVQGIVNRLSSGPWLVTDVSLWVAYVFLGCVASFTVKKSKKRTSQSNKNVNISR